MPNINSVRRTVHRVRRRIHDGVALPTSRDGFDIPESYRTLENGEVLLLFDSGNDDADRILVFGTQQTLDVIAEADDLFLDGTFKIVPELFFQLYTVHAMTRSGYMIPCIYALLPNKTRATYQRLLSELKRLRPDMNPTTIMIDFEQAAIGALQAAFPQANLTGCLFYLSQCVYRKVTTEGLATQYAADANISLHMRMLPAIAFVPQADVIAAFEAVQEDAPDEVLPVMDYFEDNYIGRLHRNRRRQPKFAHGLWNVRDRVRNGLPRTNNHIEGFHRKMMAAMCAHHPNFWRFLAVLKKEQGITNVVLAQIHAGRVADPTRATYQLIGERIATIVDDYDNRPILDFLRGIAHNLHM